MPDNYGDITRYEDMGSLDAKDIPRGGPLTEFGSTGVKRAAGVIDEEFLPALRGRKAVKVYKEMSQNDPMVGSLLFAIDKLVRQVTWRVEGNDNTPEQAEAVEFIEQCMDDMSHTWNDMVSEILSMLVYGWSWHEIVYKKRVGPWEKDPKKRSKYSDGKFGWRKIPIRGQETWLRWVFDPEGGVQAMIQMPPPYYKQVTLPINRSLLFRTGIYKGNPEGMSILRTSYRPWFIKKRLEEFEAIGVERDLAGMPVAQVPSSYMNAVPGSKEDKVYKAYKKMVQNVRRDEHDGLVLPLEYDENSNPLFTFELMSAGGTRSFDTNALIQRYEQRILMTVLADFILVGHEGEGSYAMHVDKTGIFRAALNVITDSIADVFNRHAIPRLFEINAWKLDELPRIVPNNVDPPNLTELTTFMTGMASMGMEFFPDPDLEKFLRETAHLPELPDDVMEQRRVEAEQNNIMRYAQSQMEFTGMHQKAEAVDAGMTPEQADLAAQQPTEHMQVQEQVGQQVGQAQGQLHPVVQQAQQQAMDQQDQMAQRQMALQAKDPNNKLSMEHMKAEHDLKMKSGKFDLEQKAKSAKQDLAHKTRSAKMDQEMKERDHRRDQRGKDRDYTRDQRSKDQDVKRAEAMARIKLKMAQQTAANKAMNKGKASLVPKKKKKG